MYLQNHILYYIRIIVYYLNHCRKFEFMFIHSNDQRTRSQRSLRIRFASSQCHLLRKYHVFRSSVHVCKHPFSLSRHPYCFLRAFGQALDLLAVSYTHLHHEQHSANRIPEGSDSAGTRQFIIGCVFKYKGVGDNLRLIVGTGCA